MKDGEKMFERYRNLNGNSNVFAYEIGSNYVSVFFTEQEEYIGTPILKRAQIVWKR